MLVRSAKIWRSGLKLDTIRNSSGRPKIPAEQDPADVAEHEPTGLLLLPGLVDDGLGGFVGDVRGDLGHQRGSLSRVR